MNLIKTIFSDTIGKVIIAVAGISFLLVAYGLCQIFSIKNLQNCKGVLVSYSTEREYINNEQREYVQANYEYSKDGEVCKYSTTSSTSFLNRIFIRPGSKKTIYFNEQGVPKTIDDAAQPFFNGLIILLFDTIIFIGIYCTNNKK